ncbi:MAG: ribulose-phosphate 3-epimerase [Actinomycetota bacterium]|nr:MAG: ribulose-phosphate 3-epimerase [Actinomycetota bacterium]
MIEIAPSILSADFAYLGDAIQTVEPETSWIHVDVMDGHFVPNLTIGAPVVASLRRHTKSHLDCHLMITDPWDYLADFAKAGADSVSFHFEVGRTLELIRMAHDLGMKAGMAVNPDAKFDDYSTYIAKLDLLLIMSVFPGFAGQAFIPDVLESLRRAKEIIEESGSNTILQIDGGISLETIGASCAAGAQVFVAGSAVFGQPDPSGAIRELKRAANLALEGSQ